VDLVQAAAQAGVVDQDLDRPPVLGQAADSLLDRGLAPDVEGEMVDSDAEFPLELGRPAART
jgi:hypothetical protein